MESRACQACGTNFVPTVHDCSFKRSNSQRFCSRRCASIHGQKVSPVLERRLPEGRKRLSSRGGPCEICGDHVEYHRTPSGGWSPRRMCATCVTTKKQRGNPIEHQTKGQLFASRKNWQSARTAIRRHANKVYEESGRRLTCEICGYDRALHKNPLGAWQLLCRLVGFCSVNLCSLAQRVAWMISLFYASQDNHCATGHALRVAVITEEMQHRNIVESCNQLWH
jgi:hypothetical protein